MQAVATGPSLNISRSIEGQLWLVAVLFFGIGDIVTTTIGLAIPGIVEAGPLTGMLIDWFGPAIMVISKLVVFACGYVLWRVTPVPHRLGVPLGLAVVGVLVTWWNMLIILHGAAG